MSDDSDDLWHPDANKLIADGIERMNMTDKPRDFDKHLAELSCELNPDLVSVTKGLESKQWIISSDGRVFPILNNQIFVEYSGKPPKNPIHVIEKSAYDELQAKLKAAEERLEISERSWRVEYD